MSSVLNISRFSVLSVAFVANNPFFVHSAQNYLLNPQHFFMLQHQSLDFYLLKIDVLWCRFMCYLWIE